VVIVACSIDRAHAPSFLIGAALCLCVGAACIRTGDVFELVGSEHTGTSAAGSEVTGSNTSGGSEGGALEDGFAAPCPNVLPPTWIVCEDFEAPAELESVLFEHRSVGDTFVLSSSTGASGTRSLAMSYLEGGDARGSLAFGRSPTAYAPPNFAVDQDFTDIHVRIRFKADDAWSGFAADGFLRVSSFANSDWAHAATVLVSADVTGKLAIEPFSCVQGAVVECMQNYDFAHLRSLGRVLGPDIVFDPGAAQTWRCLELRMTLNSPGATDGSIAFWLDDMVQGSLEGLDLRGSWTEYGINQLGFSGGSPAPSAGQAWLWFDDLVISTEPIGCE